MPMMLAHGPVVLCVVVKSQREMLSKGWHMRPQSFFRSDVNGQEVDTGGG